MNVPAHYLGRTVKCEGCSSDFAVPQNAVATKRWSPVVIAMCAVVALLGIWFLASFLLGLESGLTKGGGQKSVQVLYRVNSSSDGVSLTYANELGGTEQVEVARKSMPWEKRFSAKSGTYLYLSGQKSSEEGKILVEIRVDGVLLNAATSDAAFGIATASGDVGSD